MVKYPNAASGIKKVFLAKIIGVIGVPLAFIPGIGALLLMTCTVAALFSMYGEYLKLQKTIMVIRQLLFSQWLILSFQ